ncbi:MAG: hypothetical protein IPM29_23925 [Planctomycetes bacterium]|nr:hypothetical protein [Planctomycetota bacterium]
MTERNFHLLMGGVFVASIVAEQALAALLPTWNPPRLGFVSIVVGLVWVGRYAAWRAELDAERRRVLEDRIERLEARQRELERELRARHRDPLRGGGMLE